MRFACLKTVLTVLALASLRAPPAAAAPFDLAGPTLEIEVTRGARTLPIAQVPSLAAGDRIALKADLPTTESAHWLMVAAFLRGATEPPPEDWFFPCETWTQRCAREGLALTVPKLAQQLLIFLAPQTGGAYRTLVDAVRGRPGAFVRTSQDLNQAALDHARLQTYLAAVRHLAELDPTQLKDAVPLLSRSLAIKVDDGCLGKLAVLQAPCLAQGGDSLILDDGHAATLAQALTSGPASDLAMEASNTPQLRSGYYGPFIGSIMDIARILDSLHTARYQYFPALTSMHGRQAALTLNAPPSFHDPKSVLVVALPAIETPRSPTLQPVNAVEVLCAGKSPLLLPVEGAPVVFATEYAHDMTLRLTRKNGSTLELPAQPDPARGGFAVTALATAGSLPGGSGSLHGQWGFDRYEGPAFKLADAHSQSWSLAPGESADLIVGRANTLHLRADSVSCLEEVSLVDSAAKSQRVEWKRTHPNEVELTVPLQNASAGELSLRLTQFGAAEAQTVTLRAFAQAGHLESFTVHAGDTEGVLRGNRLDEVKQLSFGGVQFTPGTLSVREGHDELRMLAQSGADTHALEGHEADVGLADGRTFKVKAALETARPSAALISQSVQWAGAGENALQLGDASELPLGARLTFSIQAHSPASFSAEDQLEVATADGAFGTLLSVSAGQMMLQSRKVALVRLDPAKTLGPSAFGPLQFRRIVDGVAGDWVPLVTLVRLPRFAGVDCTADVDAPCSLKGADLFLLDSVAIDADFTHVTHVPDGFTAGTLRIPRPQQGKLYVKLRDDPAVVNVALVDVKAPPAATDGMEASPGPVHLQAQHTAEPR
ncbi:MAG TPA: hypothetical protein VMT66_16195 [Steroidobacteraceae bacterium]|nr:hypothetical protein [Steroidobacteraceae bacterium]